MLLAARDIVGGINWVANNTADETAPKNSDDISNESDSIKESVLEGKILTFITPSAIILMICGELSHESKKPPRAVKYT